MRDRQGVEMEDHCKRCKRWEEHFYWNHVDPERMHFYKVMAGNFSERMHMPKKFVKNFKKELAEVVDLKGPSGTIWHVGLEKTAGGMVFQAGWKDFVVENHIVENDLLVFRFDGESCFEVLMFNGSGCEKAVSYFIKSKATKKRERNEKSVELLNLASDNNVISCSPSSSSRDDILKELPFSSPHNDSREEQNVVNEHQRDGSSCREKIVKSNEFIVRPRNKGRRPRENSWTAEGTRKQFKQEPLDTHNNSNLALEDLIMSRRKGLTLTDAEEKKVLYLAHAVHSNNPFFISFMMPSMVSKATTRSYLTIPSAFWKTYLPSQTRTIYLQMQDEMKKWPITFLVQNISAGFSGGWRAFVEDNSLDIGDVCLFELIESGREIVMTVRFIRATEDVNN